jgi:hypothetical protein
LKQHLILGLLCTALLAAGCASQPSSFSGSGPDGPEIVLPGGKLEHARLLAMGMARSKGWTIAKTSERQVILERSLPSDAPQTALLSGDAMLASPKLQVVANLGERRNGVSVALAAFAVVNPGTEEERRVDYTTDYQDELLISLNALASAWLESRDRIASKIPLPPDPDEIQETPDSAADRIASDDQPAPVDLDAELDTGAVVETNDAQDADAGSALIGMPADTGAAGAASAALPVDSDGSAGDFADTSTAVADDNSMLVLDGQTRRGLWSFYAEASARERGCAVGERGAVLLNTSSEFELHEVQCDGGPNLLLRCQGGVCREMN